MATPTYTAFGTLVNKVNELSDSGLKLDPSGINSANGSALALRITTILGTAAPNNIPSDIYLWTAGGDLSANVSIDLSAGGTLNIADFFPIRIVNNATSPDFEYKLLVTFPQIHVGTAAAGSVFSIECGESLSMFTYDDDGTQKYVGVPGILPATSISSIPVPAPPV